MYSYKKAVIIFLLMSFTVVCYAHVFSPDLRLADLRFIPLYHDTAFFFPELEANLSMSVSGSPNKKKKAFLWLSELYWYL